MSVPIAEVGGISSVKAGDDAFDAFGAVYSQGRQVIARGPAQGSQLAKPVYVIRVKVREKHGVYATEGEAQPREITRAISAGINKE